MKKYKILGLSIFLFFIGLSNIEARKITINELSNEMNNSQIMTFLNSGGSNITSTVDTANHKLVIKDGDNAEIFSFAYTEDYVEYDNSSVTLTEEVANNELLTYFFVGNVLESIFKLSGYENYTLKEDEETTAFTNTFDTYGLQMITEHYEFTENNGNGGTSTSSGDFIRNFKVSLDTTKIDALVATYGVSYQELIKNLKPSILVKDVDEDSATLIPRVNNTYTDDTIYCYIYYSTNEDSNYSKIDDKQYKCDGTEEVKETNLKSGKTYYYKAIVVDGNNFGDPVKVETEEPEDDEEETTSSTTTTNNTNTTTGSDNEETTYKNPNTGAFLPIITVSILSIIATAVLIITNKIKVFKKI